MFKRRFSTRLQIRYIFSEQGRFLQQHVMAKIIVLPKQTEEHSGELFE